MRQVVPPPRVPLAGPGRPRHTDRAAHRGLPAERGDHGGAGHLRAAGQQRSSRWVQRSKNFEKFQVKNQNFQRKVLIFFKNARLMSGFHEKSHRFEKS